jgi:hypothetical protein
MTTGAAATSRCVRKYTAAATQNSIMQTKNTRRPSRSRRRRARTTRKARRATSARRPSTGRQRRASCAGVRAVGRRASRTCRVWRSRRRFCARRPRRGICNYPFATLDDLRKAVATFEEIEPTARRVLGSAHPLTTGIGGALRNARAALRARETSA